MDINDQMKRDGKSLPSSTWSPLVSAILVLLIPFWLLILVPGAIVSLAIRFIVSRLPLTSNKTPLVFKKSQAQADAVKLPREYDLILYGATGFTGTLAAKYLVKNYPKLKWAIAGRNQKGLEKLQSTIGLKIPIFIAESNDYEALSVIAKKAKCVISTAGPFYLYSSELLRACAEFGCHYCDITGEIDWVRVMLEMHDETARVSGAVIVNLCGHDSLPWDLAALMLNKQIASKGDVLSRVTMFDEVSAMASGGTLTTVFSIMDGFISPRWTHKSLWGFNPLLKTREAGTATKCAGKFIDGSSPLLWYASKVSHWVGPFVMAAVNANVVKRSNALLGYSSTKLTYVEAQVFPDFFSTFNALLGMWIFGTALLIRPLRLFLLEMGVLPRPGVGPSEEVMEKSFLKITGLGEGVGGSRAKVEFYFPNDPAYRDTARMLVESGLSLALRDNSKSKSKELKGGFYSPAAALGEDVIDRLVKGGSIFNVCE